MSTPAQPADQLDGIRAVLQDVLEIATTLDDQEWQQPSACAGWTVRDVMAHLAGSLDGLANATPRPPLTIEDDVEEANERIVAQLQDRSAAELVTLYEKSIPGTLARLSAFEDPQLGAYQMSLGNAGAYPLSSSKDALCFDNLVHLHADVLRPHGPIDRAAPEIDDVRMTPVLRWMVSGIPQMCGRHLAPVLSRPVRFALDGPGSVRWVLIADTDAPGGLRTTKDQEGDDVAATISSSTTDFLRWSTWRSPWQSSVEITGDHDYAAAVLALFRIV